MPLRDLSHPIETGMPVYPGDPAVRVSAHADFAADGYRVSRLEMGSHTGTHVDAPSHTEAGGKTLGEFDVAEFRFDARLADLRDLGPREAIAAERIPDTDADLLVLRTGWDEFWKSDDYLDHPYLEPEAAERCADRYDAVGVDALNVDPTPSANAREAEPEGVPAHHALLGSGTLIVENLTNLDDLPERFTLHAYPLALRGDGHESDGPVDNPGASASGDGAPVRAVAEFEP